MIARFFSGFNQMIHQVYVPVFVDAFGTSTGSKSVWMSFMLLCSPLGVTIGYEMSALAITYSNWQRVFFIEACLSLACFFTILFIPARYIEIYEIVQALKQEQSKRFPQRDSGKSGVPEVGGTGEKYFSNLARFDSHQYM